MNDYYIKITQRDAQIEFSTSDKEEFGVRLAELMRLAGALDRLPPKAEFPAPSKEKAEDVDVATEIVETKNEAVKRENTAAQLVANVEKEKTNVFENILKKEMKNPQEQVSPNFGPDKTYETILTTKRISGELDSLIFTAGYLVLYEKLKSFTLKDINRKLFPVTKLAIGHYELNDAIVKGLIDVVPNEQDSRALTRYCLTHEGEGFYNGLIK